MREVRLEVNLDVNDLVTDARLVELVKWAVNVYGVTRVQSVSVVDVKARESVQEWLDKKGRR